MRARYKSIWGVVWVTLGLKGLEKYCKGDQGGGVHVRVLNFASRGVRSVKKGASGVRGPTCD